MKKRYSSAKPYGEWLAQEVVTLEQIMASVPERGEAQGWKHGWRMCWEADHWLCAGAGRALG